MQYSEDVNQIATWAPLVMENRDPKDTIAATTMKYGTDVNFGALTRSMFNYLVSLDGVTMHFHHDVYDLEKKENTQWRIKVKSLETGKKKKVYAPFVFIGAGGGSLLLLEKANIPEGDGFGGFPVSGQWLKCTNPAVIKKHTAKVYGKASLGAPPMSVPHIDTRMIDGEKALLFGPYAGFSTKFLKNGSYFDLIKSIELSNIKTLLGAGIQNIPLTKYLIEQVFQSSNDRLKALQEYVPSAKKEDWVLENAGQRVQVIKKDADGNGILEFGTEVVCAADGSLSVLLGASPGASTAVTIMIDLIKKCFPEQVKTEAWQSKFKEMIPSFGQLLNENADLCDQIRNKTNEVLKLKC
jgi:malate dehydrogenase (quinone)